jgi:L-rhamnose mutarotase
MQKIVWTMELKEDRVQDYVEVHRKENVWPEIIAVNRRAGVAREEIFLFGNRVFICLEVEDYERMMKVFEEDEGLERWNRITLPMSKSRPELADTMTRLPLVFDYEGGRLLH